MSTILEKIAAIESEVNRCVLGYSTAIFLKYACSSSLLETGELELIELIKKNVSFAQKMYR